MTDQPLAHMLRAPARCEAVARRTKPSGATCALAMAGGVAMAMGACQEEAPKPTAETSVSAATNSATIREIVLRDGLSLDPAKLPPPWRTIESDAAGFVAQAGSDALGVAHGPLTYDGEALDEQASVHIAVLATRAATTQMYEAAPPSRIDDLIAQGLWRHIQAPWARDETWRLEAYAVGDTHFYVSADRRLQCRNIAGGNPAAWPNPFARRHFDDPVNAMPVFVTLPAAAVPRLPELMSQVERALRTTHAAS